MLCYDRTKCAVDSMTLARLTQRRNMGVIDPASVISFFQSAFSKFRKDPDKQAYDELRQDIWEGFGEIVATVDSLEDQGRLDSRTLLSYIEAAEKAMAELKGVTDQMRTKIESSWLDPRFHDFYDFMKKVVTDWRVNLLPTLPGKGLFDSVGGALSGISPGVLIAGGLALFGLLKGR